MENPFINHQLSTINHALKVAHHSFDDEIYGKAFDASLAKKSYAFMVPHKKHLGIALIVMLCAAGAGLIPPKLMQHAIDDGIRKGNIHLLTQIAIAYIVVYLVGWGLQYLQTIIISTLAQRIVNDIRLTLFAHIQHLSLDFFDKREVGRIIARLTSDIGAINGLITSGTLTFVTDVLTLVGIIIILLRTNYDLAIRLFIMIPFVLTISIIFRRKNRLAHRDVRRKVATVTAHVAENVSGVKVVKSFSRENENLNRFKKVNRETRDAAMHAVILHSIFGPCIEIISAAGTATIYWYGGLRAVDNTLTLGELWAFIGYMHLFFMPIQRISQLFQTMQDAMAGAERIFEILDTESVIQDKPGAVDLPRINGEAVFDNVNFAYGDTPILKNVSFKANPGETIALVGPTGAGKTTIINLLARQYDIKSGSITIDGFDLRDVKMESLRRQMGIVLQDSFLFPGTVKENIRYGRLDATDEEVKAAARAVGAEEFILGMEKGYETEVQEGSSNLSSGQKQILSFARALLSDPRILILDEATSSVDTRTEMVIQEALRQLLKGRTSFVVAHRLSTIAEADRILAIEGGQIVESGTHSELLANNGLYRKLHDMQFNFDLAGEEAEES